MPNTMQMGMLGAPMSAKGSSQTMPEMMGSPTDGVTMMMANSMRGEKGTMKMAGGNSRSNPKMMGY